MSIMGHGIMSVSQSFLSSVQELALSALENEADSAKPVLIINARGIVF
jgi:hypothetical protein